MSVYVGIDAHRKRSQVAVVTGDGTVQLNKNTVNGTEPILSHAVAGYTDQASACNRPKMSAG
jgi:hypothetical protein